MREDWGCYIRDGLVPMGRNPISFWLSACANFSGQWMRWGGGANPLLASRDTKLIRDVTISQYLAMNCGRGPLRVLPPAQKASATKPPRKRGICERGSLSAG